MEKTLYICDKCGDEFTDAASVLELKDGRCLCENCARRLLDGEQENPYSDARPYPLAAICRRYGIRGRSYRRLKEMAYEFCMAGKAKMKQAGRKCAITLLVKPQFSNEWDAALNAEFRKGEEADAVEATLPMVDRFFKEG